MSKQKFEINDKVKVIADKERLEILFTDGLLMGKTGVIVDIYVAKGRVSYKIKIDGIEWWLAEQDIELVEPDHHIRTFDTGATRDTTQGKLDYVKALSPIVIRRYVQYLDKHRLQPDGSYRDFDNWKKGIPQETYHSSGGRHFFDAWLLTEGYFVEDNHGPVELEDVLCAQLFNVMGRLHELLKARLDSGDTQCEQS